MKEVDKKIQTLNVKKGNLEKKLKNQMAELDEVYSNIEMIGSLCTLMARGAIVSTITVALMLASFLMIFDKVICKSTIGMKNIGKDD